MIGRNNRGRPPTHGSTHAPLHAYRGRSNTGATHGPHLLLSAAARLYASNASSGAVVLVAVVAVPPPAATDAGALPLSGASAPPAGVGAAAAPPLTVMLLPCRVISRRICAISVRSASTDAVSATMCVCPVPVLSLIHI